MIHELLLITNNMNPIYEFSQIYLLVIFAYLEILIHVLFYYTNTNTTHDARILIMIH
jgi:hypothetical protein